MARKRVTLKYQKMFLKRSHRREIVTKNYISESYFGYLKQIYLKDKEKFPIIKN